MLDPQHIDYTPPSSPLLDLVPRAVAGGGIDSQVAAHYGQPSQEQRALDHGKAVVDLSHHGVIKLSGAERLSWLHVLVSQHLADLQPGVSTETLFLDIRGRIDFAVKIIDDGFTVWIITEPGQNASVTGWLEQMKFAARVDIADVTEQYAVLGSTVPLLLAQEADSGQDDALEVVVDWTDPWPHIQPGGFTYPGGAGTEEHPGQDYSWHLSIVPRQQLKRLPDNLAEGWRFAGTMASEALRIAAGRPRHLIDTDEKSIPHELDWLRTAVHLDKGCYKGQETVARVHNLGHPPRRLTLLMIDGSVHGLPEPGADLVVRAPEATEETLRAARRVGTLTSVAQHHEMGAIGLALLKRNVDPQTELVIRETDPEDQDVPASLTAASQEVLVSPTAGNTVGRPQGLTDLRRRPEKGAG